MLVPAIAAVPGLGRLVPRIIDRRWPGVRSSVVARTRLIDDTIERTLAAQIEQVIILGAGFDSRAYRLPGLRCVAVFEVDHPDTQARKLEILEDVSAIWSAHVAFVAADFNRRDLASIVASTGYRESARTFILREGVTNY